MPSKNKDISPKQVAWEKKQEEAAKKQAEVSKENQQKQKEQKQQQQQEDDADEVFQDGSPKPPKNWPEEITYLTQPTFSDAITPEQREQLARPASEQESHCSKITAAQLATRHCAIGIISDEKHPARGQRGLLAARHLEPDAFCVLYMGRVHNNSMSDTNPRSDYDLCFDREVDLSIDAHESGNEARCANDYRGIAERPNAEFRDCFVKVPCAKRAGGARWERRVGIFVLSAGKAGLRKKGIQQGEEILISYGKQFWESRKVLATFRKDAEMLRIADAALEY